MIRVYEKRFNEKIDHFRDHPNYVKLRKSADEALRYHTGYGLDAIHAQDFMDRIVMMPLDYIHAWMDGKNQLEWVNPDTKQDYGLIDKADALNGPIQ